MGDNRPTLELVLGVEGHSIHQIPLCSHPNAGTLKHENGIFRVIFLPPNVTSLLQPMNQSIIETVKRLYRKQLLMKIVLDENKDSTTCTKFVENKMKKKNF